MSRWQTIDHNTSVDVIPLDDDRSHGYGDECWCSPRVEKTTGVPLIIHNMSVSCPVCEQNIPVSRTIVGQVKYLCDKHTIELDGRLKTIISRDES